MLANPSLNHSETGLKWAMLWGKKMLYENWLIREQIHQPSKTSLSIFQLHLKTINNKQQIENFWKSSSILEFFVKNFDLTFWKMYLFYWTTFSNPNLSLA